MISLRSMSPLWGLRRRNGPLLMVALVTLAMLIDLPKTQMAVSHPRPQNRIGNTQELCIGCSDHIPVQVCPILMWERTERAPESARPNQAQVNITGHRLQGHRESVDQTGHGIWINVGIAVFPGPCRLEWKSR